MKGIKGIIISAAAAFLVAAACPPAKAQSMGYLMEEASMVVAGEVAAEPSCERFSIYSLGGIEVVKGELESPDFRIALFRDLCYPVHLEAGKRTLMFLKRLEGDVAGLEGSGPFYVIMAGELGTVKLAGDEEPVIMTAARRIAAASAAGPEERALVMAEIFRSALETGIEPLIHGAAFDVIATPGAVERLGSYEAALALARFQYAGDYSREKRRLLYVLGELKPPGLSGTLEAFIRTKAGQYYRDEIAAVFAHMGDPALPERLITGFEDLDLTGRENVIYVLGRLGGGAGVPALEHLVEGHLGDLYLKITDALVADRTEAAVVALAEIARGSHLKAALSALKAMARINTKSARLELEAISDWEIGREEVRRTAAALLVGLSR